jgi:hypothetical protein
LQEIASLNASLLQKPTLAEPRKPTENRGCQHTSRTTKNRPRVERFRASRFVPVALAMTGGTMGLTSRNYDHDNSELWERHPKIMTMTAWNYEIDIAKL